MGTITVSDLGKAYKQYPNRWSRLLEWLDPRNKPRHTLKWVQQGINFVVQPGEAVGIIGINGAGKSTLLKMITGTTQPTTGSAHLTGRVAALLELGMGFHPDFTGRHNAIMAGQLLGYSAQEMTQLMPEIEAFAEIGDYIDQPVRVYSSGMQMRLAFSVATAIRPDILIVDEALSVGDAYFQHKSFDRIREFRKQGTTLLIVSHDKQAIIGICDSAILLSSGKVVLKGEPEAVMDYYNALLADHQNQDIKQQVLSDGKVQTISGTKEAIFTHIGLYDVNDKLVETVDVGERVILRVNVNAQKDINRLIFGYAIKTRLGEIVYGTNTHLKKQPINNVKAGSTYQVDVFFDANLGVGSYSIQIALHRTGSHMDGNYEWRDLAYVFNVVNINKFEFAGVAWIDPEIQIKIK
jgi:lipopolysaccharide transport system ATP-binding protein